MSTPVHVGVHERRTGDVWRLPLSAWLKVQEAVIGGEKWVEFVTLDGTRVHMRCADVSVLTYVDQDTAETIDARLERESFR